MTVPTPEALARAAQDRAVKVRSGRACNWRDQDINHTRLKKLMKARGFRPPPRFRALVAKLTLRRGRIVRQRVYDYHGKSTQRGGWNPASTVKIFPAIAALEFLQQHNFSPRAQVTFHYSSGAKSWRVSDLIEQAVSPSNNIAHNRLVQLVGYDWLNGSKGFFDRYELYDTHINAAYARKKWRSLRQPHSFLNTPGLTLRQGKRVVRVPARRGHQVRCYSAVCTSLADLARAQCRLMMHEQLGGRGFGYRGRRLKTDWLRKGVRKNLRGVALKGGKEVTTRHRGRQVVEMLQKALSSKRYRFYHKPGWAGKWFSDVVFVSDSRSQQRWVVAMAGYPGKSTLNRAAKIVGQLIRDGAL